MCGRYGVYVLHVCLCLSMYFLCVIMFVVCVHMYSFLCICMHGCVVCICMYVRLYLSECLCGVYDNCICVCMFASPYVCKMSVCV